MGFEVRGLAILAIASVLAGPGLALAEDSLDSAPKLDLGSISLLSDDQSEERYSISDHFGLRLGGQAFSLDLDPDYASPSHGPGSTFDAPDAMVDFYPFRGAFRLSGGFLYDDPDNAANGQHGITIGGLPFTPSQTGRHPGALDFTSYTPYAGLGVQSSFWSGRLEFALDFGLQYQGNSGAELGSERSPASASAGANERDSEEAAEQLDLLGFSPRAGLSVKLRF
jgi:hypothetical protein